MSLGPNARQLHDSPVTVKVNEGVDNEAAFPEGEVNQTVNRAVMPQRIVASQYSRSGFSKVHAELPASKSIMWTVRWKV